MAGVIHVVRCPGRYADAHSPITSANAVSSLTR
jgi:hypothetical protein